MFEERAVLPDGTVMELIFSQEDLFRLSVKKGQKLLVRYWNQGKGHRRQVCGRESAYDFKSVEKLRYDFERDAEDAQHQG